jgi:hypothetical protein
MSTVRWLGVPSSSMLSEPRGPGRGPGAAAPGQRSVVDDGDAGRRHPLAHPIGKRGGLLAVEVSLETVADRLVQEDAGPAGAEYDVERTGGAGPGLEVECGDAHRLVDQGLPGIVLEQVLELVAPSRALVANLAAAAGGVGGDHLHVEPHERSGVADPDAVVGGDHHLAVLGDHAGHDLLHAGVAGAGVGVDAFEDLDLLPDRHLGGDPRHRVEVAVRRSPLRHGGRRACAAPLGDRPGRSGSELEALHGDLVGMGVALPFTGLDAHAHALLDVALAALHDPFLERDLVLGGVLEEEIRRVHPPLERRAERPLERAVVQAEAVPEEHDGRFRHPLPPPPVRRCGWAAPPG